MEEARDRNRALNKMYGRMPSYAIFSADDIEHESELTRMAWWMDIESTDATVMSLILKYTSPPIVLDALLVTMRQRRLDEASEILIEYKSILQNASMFERTMPIHSCSHSSSQ